MSRRPRVDWDKVARLVLRVVPILPMPEIYDLARDLQRSRGELSEKVNRAAAALQEASQLVDDLQNQLAERVDSVQKLKLEYERYQHLATVEEPKAKALIEQLQEALGAGRTRERWIALAINLAAGLIVFVLGVWLSPRVRAILGIGE
mgnify:CR=1 FL=1